MQKCELEHFCKKKKKKKKKKNAVLDKKLFFKSTFAFIEGNSEKKKIQG